MLKEASLLNSEQRVSKTRICICVDDFGLSEGVNTAVLTLVAQRRVHATSCMVFAPAWVGGAAALHQLDGHRMDIGLHLDFTEYTSQPSMRHSLRALIVKSMFGLLDTAEIRAEIQAQFDAFERAMGRRPDFIDGHQHVHQLPCIRDMLVAEMQQRYGHARPWIRISQGLPFGAEVRTSGWRVAVKSAVISVLGSRALSGLARRAGIARNGRLLGIHGFGSDEEGYRLQLDKWLNSATDTDLLMCHPSARACADDAIGEAREIEFSVLQGAALPRMLAKHGIVLRAMSQMRRSQC